MLGTGQLEQHIVVGSHPQLCLQLGGDEMMVHIFYIADSCEGHLLLHIVSEPVTTNRVSENGRCDGTEKQSAVEHRLEGEAVGEGEGLAPVGVDITHACLTVEFGEIVGHIGVFRLETCTACGEVPVVLAVVVQFGAIAVEVLVVKLYLHGLR